MAEQDEQTTKPTKRTRAPKATAPSQASKTDAPRRSGSRSKGAPKAEAPATRDREPNPRPPGRRAHRLSVSTPAETRRRERMEARPGGAPSRDEMSIALTPGQMAVGGAIMAGLLVVRRAVPPRPPAGPRLRCPPSRRS